MSVQPAPAASAEVPREWTVDHHAPTDYVVRCTECGRIAIKDDRGRAHRHADNHSIVCAPSGVTPVSRPTTADDGDGPDVDGPSTSVLGLDAAEHDLVGQELTVDYESVSGRAGSQRITGDVVAMCAAPDEADIQYEGLVLRLPDQARRRIDLVEGRVQCSHNCPSGWRTIGDLERIAPGARAADDPVVMTDGGVWMLAPRIQSDD